jgi:hypothetical protein
MDEDLASKSFVVVELVHMHARTCSERSMESGQIIVCMGFWPLIHVNVKYSIVLAEQLSRANYNRLIYEHARTSVSYAWMNRSDYPAKS